MTEDRSNISSLLKESCCCVLHRLLANEIQRLQKTSGDQEKDLRSQIDELRKDNNRQQKLIGQVKKKGDSDSLSYIRLSSGITGFHAEWFSLAL